MVWTWPRMAIQEPLRQLRADVRHDALHIASHAAQIALLNVRINVHNGLHVIVAGDGSGDSRGSPWPGCSATVSHWLRRRLRPE